MIWSSETLEELITAQHLMGQPTCSVTILAFLSLPDPPALWNVNLSAGAGGSISLVHFLGAPFSMRGRSFLLQPSLLAVANTEQGGVWEEMIPVWLLEMRCAWKAGAGTEAMQKYSVVLTLQSALASSRVSLYFGRSAACCNFREETRSGCLFKPSELLALHSSFEDELS